MCGLRIFENSREINVVVCVMSGLFLTEERERMRERGRENHD